MFTELKHALRRNFERMSKTGPLFYVTIDRDKIFAEYLAGFPTPELRQEHTCNCCKSFLRQFGGIVAIEAGRPVSIWDGLESTPGYEQPITQLQQYIHSLLITDILLVDTAAASQTGVIGTDKSFDPKINSNWEHFSVMVPSRFLAVGVDAKLGEARSTKEVFERGMRELKLDALDTVLELIDQNSLYRGQEHKASLTQYRALLLAFGQLKDHREQEAFLWLQAATIHAGLARLRNTSIGTLLIDLSDGLDLDSAVAKFEKMVAPTNYKRPTALVTPRMVEAARAEIKELGLESALERRLADARDVPVEQSLFVYRRPSIGDVFDEITKDTLVNPKSLEKVEVVPIADFLSKVVPKAKSLEVLFENRHMKNAVSLVTTVDPSAPLLFKWNNPLSWSYTGGITDSIKERVKEAGGNVEGELRVSLSWSNYDDLDLHVTDPNREEVWFANKRIQSGGVLDVDMNAGSGTTRTPVENVTWQSSPPAGRYQVTIDNYSKRESTNTGFTVQVEYQGQVFEFGYAVNTKTTHLIFDLTPDGLTFQDGQTSRTVSKEKWGLKTNQFHRVNLLALSPNHWPDNAVGNRHHFFFLEVLIERVMGVVKHKLYFGRRGRR